MTVEEKVPGVTLHLENSTLGPPGSNNLAARGVVVLSAEINDLDVWNTVLVRLKGGGKGFRVYSSNTFSEEVIDVMREQLDETRESMEKSLQEKDRKITALEQQLSFARAEAEKYRVTATANPLTPFPSMK